MRPLCDFLESITLNAGLQLGRVRCTARAEVRGEGSAALVLTRLAVLGRLVGFGGLGFRVGVWLVGFGV